MLVKFALKSLDKTTLNLYILFLKKILIKFNIKDITIQKLPLKKKRITLLKSPHVNKKAREQFELKIYKTLITFTSVSTFFYPYLILNKPKNLKICIKINKRG